jgi:transposase InsO family protein
VAIPGGFVYLAAILDAWSRKVVGYAISRSMDARIAVAALEARHQEPAAFKRLYSPLRQGVAILV